MAACHAREKPVCLARQMRIHLAKENTGLHFSKAQLARLQPNGGARRKKKKKKRFTCKWMFLEKHKQSNHIPLLTARRQKLDLTGRGASYA